jgi:hypothetical protein
MARDLDLPLHLKADDFRDAIAGRGAVPLRFEFRQVGLVKAIEIGEGAFELSWSSDGGLVVNRQIITLHHSRTGDALASASTVQSAAARASNCSSFRTGRGAMERNRIGFSAQAKNAAASRKSESGGLAI